jgi:formyltetrahydrofolate hydrolase
VVTLNAPEQRIIEQDVVRVDHRHSVDDLTRLGVDVEWAVLWHCEDCVIRYGNPDHRLLTWGGHLAGQHLHSFEAD